MGRRPTLRGGGSIRAESAEHGDRLIAAFFRHYETSADDDWWAWEEIGRSVRQRPGEAWPIVRRLINEAPDDRARFYVAAGPPENLVKDFGNELWAEIEREARQNRLFLEALSGIYLDESYNAIYTRWRELMERYGLIGPE